MASRRRSGRPVTCIACGSRVDRAEAREYDREGNRWDRAGKSFEFLCKPCFALENHQARDELESTLLAVGTDHEDAESFVTAYYRIIAETEAAE